MKQPFNTKFSVFKSLFKSKETPYTQSLTDIYQRIKVGNKELINKIDIIRNEKSKEKRDEVKKTLIAILFNGTFTDRNDKSLIEHSGLCIIDFDNYETKEKMMEHWDMLVKDKYTLMAFISPSGMGIKLLIRIPKCDLHEHKRRFKAYQKYINADKYFDEKNCNISRVCFESYDPNIYINQFAEEFKEIEVDKGYSKLEKVPVCPVLDELKIIERIVNWDWEKRFELGNRNSYVYNLASSFCEYGIPQSSAEQYLLQNIVDDYNFDEEAMIAIKSAYKGREFGKYYFEDYEVKKQIKSKLKKGVNPVEIAKSHSVDFETVTEIQNDIFETVDVFWEINKTKTGKEIISIEPYKYAMFLTKNGFMKYYPENAEQPTFVRVIENKVNMSSPEMIKDFVLNYLLDKKQLDVWNFVAGNTKIFTSQFLNMIDSIYLKMLQDDKETSFIPFKNGVVKVSKTNVELLNYIDVDGYIWENQIINRDFIKCNDFKNDFQDFISKITNQDNQRTKSLESTLGYLIHAFKDKTDQKAIIFNDQEIDDNPNGGSGKSLMLNAIKQVRKMVIIDGKIFDPKKSDFVYQRVNLDTQILAFDDVKKNFNFEQLFSIITEGITVNRKNKDEIFIPFERSPKIVITTNYVINGSGNSHERRRHEIEIFQYFNDNHTPTKEYGRLLFDSWNDDDWNKFMNYIIYCLQIYLNNGLVKVDAINSEKKKLIQSTCKEFFDWVNDDNLYPNVKMYNREVLSKFIQENQFFKDLAPRKFVSWISEYAKYKKYEFNKDKDHNGRYFVLIKKQETETEKEQPKQEYYEEREDGLPF